MNKLILGLVKELRPLQILTTFTAVYLAFSFANAEILNLKVALFFLSGGFLLYSVHCLDTYEDDFVRGEDAIKDFTFGHGSGGEITEVQLKWIAAASSLGFILSTIWLETVAGPVFLAPIIAAFLVGITYSRYLSWNLVASLLAYPTGVVLAMASAYLLSSGSQWDKFAILCLPVFLLLLGAKSWMDIGDSKADLFTGKPNLANISGEALSKQFSTGALILGVLFFLSTSFSILLLLFSALAIALFLVAHRTETKRGIWLVGIGVYFFLIAQVAVQLGLIR